MIEEMHSCIDAKTSCQFHDVIYSLYLKAGLPLGRALKGPDNDYLFAGSTLQPVCRIVCNRGGHFNNPSPKIVCD